MSSKISALAAGTPAQSTDQIPINRAGSNFSLTVSDIVALAGGLVTPGGRLTLTSGTPVTTADVTAAGTLYYAPYIHDYIMLYSGSAWQAIQFTERSLALTLTSGNTYDVFGYNNAGTLTLETLIWTNPTTRATALVRQNGRLVKSGDATRLYLGTIYASGANTTEDSVSKRFVWNQYNRAPRNVLKQETTASWTYAVSAWQQTRATSTNQIECVIGIADTASFFEYVSMNSGGEGTQGIGIDSNTPDDQVSYAYGGHGRALYTKILAVGYHTVRMCEYRIAGTVTLYGTYSGLVMTHLTGWVMA